MMVIVCHNTDLGDGWEREGMNEWYFHEFSEKRAYPLGINIVTYAMAKDRQGPRRRRTRCGIDLRPTWRGQAAGAGDERKTVPLRFYRWRPATLSLGYFHA